MKSLFLLATLLTCSVSFADWQWSFDEKSSKLTASNGEAHIDAKLSFESGGKMWTLADARDGANRRLALADPEGDVQGYIVLPQDGDTLEILCHHRTAQNFAGALKIDGTLKFYEDSFTCRTIPAKNERVLTLKYGPADSRLNDSLYSPSADAVLNFQNSALNISSDNAGVFKFAAVLNIANPAEAFLKIDLKRDYLKKRYVPYFKALDKKRLPRTPTGWMAWNIYFDKATAADNLAEARIGKTYLQPFGCEYWSIESWQANSAALPVSKFYNMNLETSTDEVPQGMKALADEIRALGFKPGIWIAPFGTGNVEFYTAHKDWFLHEKNGAPVKSWNGVYTLDPTNAEARAHLKEIFRIASQDWGYEFFKIDGMSGRNSSYCAHLYERPEIKARFKDPSCPNPFELCVRAFREGIGADRIFLACQGHTSGAEAAYADASRIGADIVHPGKPVKWDNVKLQGRCTINQIFTHNISMIADPDTLLVGDLTLEEARTSATIVALPGQLTFFGDKLGALPQERMKILQQTLPPAYVRPMNIYPRFEMLPVWNLVVKSGTLGSYNAAALFNWSDEPNKIEVKAEELGLDPSQIFYAFEFWTQQALGDMRGIFMAEVPAHGVRIVRLTPISDIPQIVGSDRHVSQTSEEIKACSWDAQTHTLNLSAELVADFPLTLVLRVPANFTFASIEASNALCSVSKCDGGALFITLKAAAQSAPKSLTDIKITFKPKNI